MSGIYIHIPFCKSRCIYCGFYSTTLFPLVNEYVSALCKEAYIRRCYLTEPVETVYLGGGTPSQLPLKELSRLLIYINKVFNIAPDAEITVECNPDDVTIELAECMSEIGVNRVSMGAQTFSDNRLRLIHRRHNAADVATAVDILRHIGIDDISIDLIFGFPNETMMEWESDIEHALALHVEHISAYSLMYEEGTVLEQKLRDGAIEEIDEETELAMYDVLISRLENAGYEHYEISNFALPGHHSRHNSGYWQQKPYIGIGAAAHSYNLASRQWNVCDVKQYISAINNGIIPCEREVLDKRTCYNDLITTALRTSTGIDLGRLKTDFGAYFQDYCQSMAGRYIGQGLLEMTSDKHLRLTRKGLFVSDMIMSDLIKL